MDMMKQLAQMQQEMMRAQEDLANEQITVVAGGGAVTIVIDGRQQIHDLKIDPKAIEQGDVGLLEDLIKLAFNDAVIQSQSRVAEKLQGLASGLNLPGLK